MGSWVLLMLLLRSIHRATWHSWHTKEASRLPFPLGLEWILVKRMTQVELDFSFQELSGNDPFKISPFFPVFLSNTKKKETGLHPQLVQGKKVLRTSMIHVVRIQSAIQFLTVSPNNIPLNTSCFQAILIYVENDPNILLYLHFRVLFLLFFGYLSKHSVAPAWLSSESEVSWLNLNDSPG